MKARFFVYLLVFLPAFYPGNLLQGQTRFPLSVKTGILGISGDRFSLHVDWAFNRKSSLEIWGAYGQFPREGLDLYQGQLIIHYAQRRAKYFRMISGKSAGDTGWEYLSASRPLEPVPEHVPLSFFQIGLGQQFMFPLGGAGKWHWCMKPGISVFNAEFYEIEDNLIIDKVENEHYSQGEYPVGLWVYVTTNYYNQDRTMQVRNHWMGGLTYDLGINRRIWRGLFLEAAICMGLNFTVAYESPRPPAPLARYWALPAFSLGYNFNQ